jgi:hypothetical protein
LLYDLMFEQPTAHEDNWFEGAWKIYVPLPTDLVVAIYLCSSCSAPTTVSHTAGCSALIASNLTAEAASDLRLGCREAQLLHFGLSSDLELTRHYVLMM